MTLIFRRALTLLDSAERRHLYLLLALSSVAAVVQAVAILSIMPFILLLANPDVLESNEYLRRVFEYVGAESYAHFLAVFGAFGLVVLTIGNMFLAFEHWLSHRFIVLLNHRLEKLVLWRMLEQTYEQHVGQHSARLSDVVLNQVERVVDGVVNAFIVLFSNLVLTAFIVLLLLVVSLTTTIITLVALFIAYLCVFMLLRRKIASHGEELTRLSGNLSTHVREMLDGIREIKARRVERYFARRFEASSFAMSKLAIRYGLLSFLPYFILETLVFAGLVGIALYFVLTTESAGISLSYIALYGMAIYRLVPALQSVFDAVSDIHHNGDAVRIVREHCDVAKRDVPQKGLSVPADAIGLRNVTYAYSGSADRQIHDVSLSVPVGSSLCLFGPSGSGKSTLLNILMGFLYPQQGHAFCDGTVLGPETRDGWRAQIGYCPQQVFLFDDTVSSNIAFGVESGHIDVARVRAVAELAGIRTFVEEQLEHGFDTVIGEDGKTLSGGQQQRIGIARVLYHDPAVLLLDESFTGLDAAVKERILDNLFTLQGKTLIFSSHEPGIAARCDAVAMIDRGRVIECGAYEAVAGLLMEFSATDARRP